MARQRFQKYLLANKSTAQTRNSPLCSFIDTCSVHGSAPPQIRVRPTSRVRESPNVRDALDRHELKCMWHCSVVRLWLSSAHVSLSFVIALHSDVPAEL